MINQAINEILEAESRAIEIIAEAKAKLKAIETSSSVNMDELVAKTQAKIKAEVKVILDTAIAEGEKQASAIIKNASLEADKIAAFAEKNKNNAIDYIFGVITNVSK